MMVLDEAAPMVVVERPIADRPSVRSVPDPLSDRGQTTSDISVLTYNVRGLPWPLASGRGDALRAIGQELAQMRQSGVQPDVVLIQEGFRREVAELVQASGYRYWAKGPGRGPGFGRLASAGLHVLSDAPILDVRRHAFGTCAGLDCFANKGAMRVRLAIAGSPTPIDIINTHLNSRSASRAAPAESLAAHNAQIRQLDAFVSETRAEGVPVIVGGDFNVKNAPQRYYFNALERPYTVVSEYCSQRAQTDCGGEDPITEPWLRSQDLQAFVPDEQVSVRPLKTDILFAGAKGRAQLSDHEGYVVRYQLQWSRPDPTFKYRASDSVVVKPRMGAWGVKISWKP